MTTLPRAQFANLSFVTPQLAVGGDLDSSDRTRALMQLAEVVHLGITHVVDVRSEWSDAEWFLHAAPAVRYLSHGMDDAGQNVPPEWFEQAASWVEAAWAQDPDAVVLSHCQMGINRGPSLGFALLLAQGWDPVDAIAAIRMARPQANVWYAADALDWHHARTGISDTVAAEQHAAPRRVAGGEPARRRPHHPADPAGGAQAAVAALRPEPSPGSPPQSSRSRRRARLLRRTLHRKERPVHLSALLDVDLVAVETTDELTLLVELTAPTPATAAKRQPATLIVVLDRSGSMRGGRLQAAQAALLSLVDRLEPADRLSAPRANYSGLGAAGAQPLEASDQSDHQLQPLVLPHPSHT